MRSDTAYNIHHAIEDHRNVIDESEKRILIYVCGERFRRGFHMTEGHYMEGSHEYQVNTQHISGSVYYL